MPIEETLDALEPRLQRHIKKAQRALEEGQTGYTIEVCLSVLNRHPGCAGVRQLLHEARKRVPAPASSPLAKLLTGALHSLKITYAATSVRRHPFRTLAIVENILCDTPEHTRALRLLGQAAEVLGFPRTIRLAYQTLLEVEPENPANAVALGSACLACADPRQAVALGRRALGLDPACRDAQDLIKKAAVALSMKAAAATPQLPH